MCNLTLQLRRTVEMCGMTAHCTFYEQQTTAQFVDRQRDLHDAADAEAARRDGDDGGDGGEDTISGNGSGGGGGVGTAARSQPTQRPDVIIQLPNRRYVVVDAKVPMTMFQAAMAASLPSERDALMRKHSEAVRRTIKELSGKQYWRQLEPLCKGGASPELVVRR
jgi:hypothetical protein